MNARIGIGATGRVLAFWFVSIKIVPNENWPFSHEHKLTLTHAAENWRNIKGSQMDDVCVCVCILRAYDRCGEILSVADLRCEIGTGNRVRKWDGFSVFNFLSRSFLVASFVRFLWLWLWILRGLQLHTALTRYSPTAPHRYKVLSEHSVVSFSRLLQPMWCFSFFLFASPRRHLRRA